jgi:hypothetical protein
VSKSNPVVEAIESALQRAEALAVSLAARPKGIGKRAAAEADSDALATLVAFGERVAPIIAALTEYGSQSEREAVLGHPLATFALDSAPQPVIRATIAAAVNALRAHGVTVTPRAAGGAVIAPKSDTPVGALLFKRAKGAQ